ncbi:uncharacterized protein C8Q71DRAFT_394361 [Rhodofomes roseus]|uniref:Secreted protein n=1 Tax=Rhodofomes roseus TaxID=34475 RepID=A0ABQ8JZV3_9APHY|nr:uncharacterized protein C8Q71DRAFT_394361 [Rhodofomes roseus]KAH9829914.1 hypothetical protein C8Q71DRAFT_394361 [Rhodofomes roseus]
MGSSFISPAVLSCLPGVLLSSSSEPLQSQDLQVSRVMIGPNSRTHCSAALAADGDANTGCCVSAISSLAIRRSVQSGRRVGCGPPCLRRAVTGTL